MDKNSEISASQELYLKSLQRRQYRITAIQILIFILFLLLWETAVQLGWIDGFIFSSPSRVLKTFGTMWKDRSIFLHTGITLAETLISFAFVVITGVGMAVLLWYNQELSLILEPYLVVLNSLPKVALGPIIIIWVGAGTPAIITMALAISLIVTIMEMLNGFTSTDENKIKMVKTFGANKLQIFCKIVFPSNIPTLLNAFKVNIGLCMVGVITGEFLVSKAGLGYLIVYGGQVFKLDLVMTSVIILAIVASLMYQGIILLGKLIGKKNKWQ